MVHAAHARGKDVEANKGENDVRTCFAQILIRRQDSPINPDQSGSNHKYRTIFIVDSK